MDTTTTPPTITLTDVTLVLKALTLAKVSRVPASPADVDLSEASVSLYAYALNVAQANALPLDPIVHWARLLNEAKTFLDVYGDARPHA